MIVDYIYTLSYNAKYLSMVLNTTEQKDYNYNIRQINKKITPLTDLYFHLRQWNKERKERKYPSDKEYINFLRYMQVYL